MRKTTINAIHNFDNSTLDKFRQKIDKEIERLEVRENG